MAGGYKTKREISQQGSLLVSICRIWVRFAGPSLSTVVHSGPGACNEYGMWMLAGSAFRRTEFIHSTCFQAQVYGMNGLWM